LLSFIEILALIAQPDIGYRYWGSSKEGYSGFILLYSTADEEQLRTDRVYPA
jgi:hypothetical protein